MYISITNKKNSRIIKNYTQTQSKLKANTLTKSTNIRSSCEAQAAEQRQNTVTKDLIDVH